MGLSAADPVQSRVVDTRLVSCSPTRRPAQSYCPQYAHQMANCATVIGPDH